MATDATTFFFAFLTVFAGLGAYIWHLHKLVADLEARLDAVATKPKNGGSDRSL